MQNIVQKLVLDYRSEQLRNLLEIRLRVLVKEAILVEEAVQELGDGEFEAKAVGGPEGIV